MTIGRDWRMGRRDFLQTTAGGALALTIGTPPAAAEDHQARHNMLVFGERAVFLSHLPMFDGLSADGTDFASPHRYQVILEAAFTSAQLDTYVKDRQANPGSRFYTLGPAPFVLSRLFTPQGAPALTSFTASVFRGHLEAEPNNPVPALQNIPVKVARVVHGRKFDPRASKPAELEYLLLGRGRERFVAHAIFAPPDFDQVLPVGLTGVELTDRDLSQDIRSLFPAGRMLRQSDCAKDRGSRRCCASARLRLPRCNSMWALRFTSRKASCWCRRPSIRPTKRRKDEARTRATREKGGRWAALS